jgi:hypothetical protein
VVRKRAASASIKGWFESCSGRFKTERWDHRPDGRPRQPYDRRFRNQPNPNHRDIPSGHDGRKRPGDDLHG